jgi:DegV family protein with EDD domain
MTSQKIVIVTDSAAYMPQELLTQWSIPVIPQTLIWDGETYRDGVDIDAPTFYSRLRASKSFPTTSQPTAPEFADFFQRVATERQTDTILAVLVSSKMSGTVASALAAKEELPGINIHIVDTGLISMGMGFPIIAGARAVEEGKSLDEVIAVVESVRDRIHFLGAVGNLEYLHRGGRIGGAKRLLGTALNLKPLLHFENGQLEALAQVRTRRKALARMLDIAEERLGGKQMAEAAVADVDCPAEGDAVAGMVTARFGVSDICRCTFSPVVGAHAGPGTTSIIFYARE